MGTLKTVASPLISQLDVKNSKFVINTKFFIMNSLDMPSLFYSHYIAQLSGQ